MRKTAKFTAIVLAVVLALSCFSVAFAARYIVDDTKEYFNTLGGIIKDEGLKEGLNFVKMQAKRNYDRMFDEDNGQIIIPQLRDLGKIIITYGDGSRKVIWFGRDYLDKLYNNPVLDSLEQKSVPALTKIARGLGTIFGLEDGDIGG